MEPTLLRTDLAPLIQLKNYREPEYSAVDVHLNFELDPTETLVTSTVTYTRGKGVQPGTQLKLDGDELEFISLKIDGETVSPTEYKVGSQSLVIKSPPKSKTFVVEVVTRINPTSNRKLMGLYRSGGNYCTQCEAEGFRRITYFTDRPDVLATYTTRIVADKSENPILLGNGNPVKKGSAGKGKHYAIWHDPHPKPSYLFALVAGDLAAIFKPHKTASGRKVKLGIYVEKGKEDRAHYAMDALIRSMRWDEEVFGCEYDLDIFNIVAVSDFNMGAMENKGLNIFNDKYVLADPKTATDQDYQHIEAIIAHEYFHNWTGNRITCRDWFQLCLKEGLTVFRDQEFSADQRSRGVKRIADVRLLKANQFPEDAGPLAHPVRPENYREINNFYTATVYEKGAELVRMLKTMLGDKIFESAIKRYLKKHDGEAATIEQFLECFEFVSKQDLSKFALWYSQAGTPTLSISKKFHPSKKRLDVEVVQSLGETPGQARKRPMQMPLRIGLISKDGKDLIQQSKKSSKPLSDVFELSKRQHRFSFDGLDEEPVISINRDFSAPVNLDFAQTKKELSFLALNDSDGFNRWQAYQEILGDNLVRATRALSRGKKPKWDARLLEATAEIAEDKSLEPAYRAQVLSLPTEGDVAQMLGKQVDPDAVMRARSSCMVEMGLVLERARWDQMSDLETPGTFSPSAENAGKRALKNLLLNYSVVANFEDAEQYSLNQFKTADNMTDEYAALMRIVHFHKSRGDREMALNDFYEKYKQDHLVIDKWFMVQASEPGTKTVSHVAKLLKHPDFSTDVPNRIRSLVGVFAAANLSAFAAENGRGFKLVAELIAKLDKTNPQVAARILTAFRSYKSLEPKRRDLADKALKSIRASGELSPDVGDILQRTLL